MPVAPTITSQLITEFGDRENSGGGSYIIYKRTQFGPRTQKKQSVSFWQCPCAWVWLFFFWCLIKNGPHKTDVWCGDWSALVVAQMEPERCWQALEGAWTHKRHICRHIYKQTQETSQIRMCTVEGMHTYQHRHISGETYLHKYYPSQNTHTHAHSYLLSCSTLQTCQPTSG